MARTDYYGIQTPVLQATSQAIRTVNGTVGTIAPEDYPDLIAAMKSGTDYDNVMAQLVEETTTPASIASFTDGANNLPVKEVVCSINPTETGSGAKSPSNPYIIGGHTGINVTQVASNLWDEDWETGDINITTGETQSSSVYIRSNNFCVLKPNTQYCVSLSSTSVFYYDASKAFISRVLTSADNQVFTAPANTAYFKIKRYSTSGYGNDISINCPSSVTGYHAYNGRTHHADFGQTVYGGEFVAKEGEFDKVRPTIGVVDMGDLNWTYFSNTTPPHFGANITGMLRRSPLMCEGYTPVNNAPYGNTDGTIRATDEHSVNGIKVSDTNYTDATTFKSAVTGIKVSYQYATPPDPIVLPTKTQVKTLLGANNLYHDCNGNIEVEYRANGALYVAQH